MNPPVPAERRVSYYNVQVPLPFLHRRNDACLSRCPCRIQRFFRWFLVLSCRSVVFRILFKIMTGLSRRDGFRACGGRPAGRRRQRTPGKTLAKCDTLVSFQRTMYMKTAPNTAPATAPPSSGSSCPPITVPLCPCELRISISSALRSLIPSRDCGLEGVRPCRDHGREADVL